MPPRSLWRHYNAKGLSSRESNRVDIILLLEKARDLINTIFLLLQQLRCRDVQNRDLDECYPIYTIVSVQQYDIQLER